MRVPFSLAILALLSSVLYPAMTTATKGPPDEHACSEVFPMARLNKRGDVFYAQYYLGGRQVRISLDTDSLQVAKETLRQL